MMLALNVAFCHSGGISVHLTFLPSSTVLCNFSIRAGSKCSSCSAMRIFMVLIGFYLSTTPGIIGPPLISSGAPLLLEGSLPTNLPASFRPKRR